MHFMLHKLFWPAVLPKSNSIAFIALLICSNSMLGQISKRDSLLFEIYLQRNDTEFNRRDTIYIHNLIQLANENRYYHLDSVMVLSTESLELSRKISFLNGEIASYLNMGSFHSDKGKAIQAIAYFKKAYDLADKTDKPQLKVKSLNNLAGEYRYQGNYSQALKGYLDALEIAEEINLKSMQSIINENIANLYLSQKDYNQAMVFFKKVKAINMEIGNPIYMAETMSNMASAYADMNDVDYAMFNINNSIAIFEKHKILEWLAYCYEIKGKIYLKKGKNNWALYWYKQSELLHKKIEDERGEIVLLNGISNAYFNKKNDSIAEIYALKSLQLSEKIDDKNGTRESSNLLFKINKNNTNFKEALRFHEIYQATNDSLEKKDNEKALHLLKAKMEYDQQKQKMILENEKILARQKTYQYVFIIILVIFFAVVLLVHKNERIQKTLNKELLSQKKTLEENQSYLNELNQTKNKLFSIIGHDLRGPISAFQGLLKLFREGDMNKEEFLNFLPKLKVDIDTISFTLNNLLSWGQSQMNGSVTNPMVTHLDTIVKENIALLTEIAELKSITLINNVEPNCHIWSDPNQIDIIIRNLLSNALKFTPSHGQIIIGAIQKLKHCEIYVKDNGLGMNEETLGKIFNKYSNHTTYGTNDEKGTGLGLSLCVEMVEKNQGRIWANSVLGKGSSFYFTVPRVTENYKKSA